VGRRQRRHVRSRQPAQTRHRRGQRVARTRLPGRPSAPLGQVDTEREQSRDRPYVGRGHRRPDVIEHRRQPAHALGQLGRVAQQRRPRRRSVQLLQVRLPGPPAQLGTQLVRRHPDQPVRQRVGELVASLHPRGRQPGGQVGVQQRHRGRQLGDVAQRAPRAGPGQLPHRVVLGLQRDRGPGCGRPGVFAAAE
jgi:hypothetical protein